MSSDHPYTRLPIPADAPVELRPSPGKGYGAFATRDIKKNEVILRESHLFLIKKPLDQITEAHVRRAYKRLPPQRRQMFQSMRDDRDSPFENKLIAFHYNSAYIPQADGAMAYGTYVLISRFNHSCIPNARVMHQIGKPAEILANGDIAAGEEVVQSYHPSFHTFTSSERRSVLGFRCDCRACKPGTDYQLLSDLRRRFIRALFYLVTGVDDGPDHTCLQSPIIDPEIREAAREWATPLTSKFVHGLMYFAMLDAEGLINDSSADLAADVTVMAATLFKTKSNIRVADLIGKQKSRFEKFGMASTIYGEPDEGEEISSMMLRAAFGPQRRAHAAARERLM